MSRVIATDDFNRADGGLGANWQNVVNTGVTITSNQAAIGAVGGGNRVCSWVPTLFGRDQYAQVTIKVDNYCGPAVRCDPSGGGNSYAHVNNGANRFFYKYVNGSGTQLSGGGGVPGVGDVVMITVISNLLAFYLNGSLTDSLTDGSLIAGQPGFQMTGDTVGGAVDDWSAGDPRDGNDVSANRGRREMSPVKAKFTPGLAR